MTSLYRTHSAACTLDKHMHTSPHSLRNTGPANTAYSRFHGHTLLRAARLSGSHRTRISHTAGRDISVHSGVYVGMRSSARASARALPPTPPPPPRQPIARKRPPPPVPPAIHSTAHPRRRW
jgi:hypothetical protein